MVIYLFIFQLAVFEKLRNAINEHPERLNHFQTFLTRLWSEQHESAIGMDIPDYDC